MASNHQTQTNLNDLSNESPLSRLSGAGDK